MLGTLLVKTCLKQAQPGRADFSSSLLQHGNFSMIKALRACMFMILFHLGGALCSCIRLCTGHCNSIFLFVFLSLSLFLSACPWLCVQWNKLRTRYVGNIQVNPQECELLELRLVREKGRPIRRRWTQGHACCLSVNFHFQANLQAAKETFLQTCHSILFHIACCSIRQRLALQDRVEPVQVSGHQRRGLVYLGYPFCVSGPVQAVCQDTVARCHTCHKFLVGL